MHSAKCSAENPDVSDCSKRFKSLILFFGATAITEDELLNKIQSTIDEQQSKLTELKNKVKEESQKAIDDLEPKIRAGQSKNPRNRRKRRRQLVV
ncbi:hypothetical protein [Methylotuvimicrobium sp. KM2]|uniref:hypothetical protein n=1 Tax=Methylotuvimicrobium sp. KM2 TaxID=3133976 RepID=UPI0031011BCE